MSLLVVPMLPLAAVLASMLPWGRRFPAAATLTAEALAFVLAVWEAARVVSEGRLVALASWAELDGFGAILLLLVTFVGLTAALFSWGYIGEHEHEPRRIHSYYVHFNLFVFSLVLVPVLAEPAFVWIAIEFTAVFSVLLVAFDGTHTALEAAWKYIALMFMGAAVALLGFFILFWAQDNAGGGHFTWYELRLLAPRMSPVLVRFAFLLILVGFGTKVGFVPMHTWLPDAHSQAPSPVCALLSGVKTTAALYCILRLVPLLTGDGLQVWMQAAGLLSAGVAAFLLLQVRDYKRLFAYSTVEHMGIIFFAAGLGTAGNYGALLQMVSHSLTKSFCFFAAGATLLLLGTREIEDVRGLIRTSRIAGVALLLGALAIGGAPPFAVFLSEFSIIRAALAQQQYLTTALLLVFITVAFCGILLHVNRMLFGTPANSPENSPRPVRAPLPFSCVLTLVLAAAPVFVLGVYQPAPLHELLNLAVANLTSPQVLP